MKPLHEPVTLGLTDDEWFLLDRGLVEWSGPARPTDAMAAAMGFVSLELFRRDRERLRGAIERREPLTRWDWARVLLATEIVFSSSIVGSGTDWDTSTGLDDVGSFMTLRRLQLKITPVTKRDILREEERGRYDAMAAETELARWRR